MTDNEKAASFIGWNPDMLCNPEATFYESRGWICEECGAYRPYPELVGDPPRHKDPHHFDHVRLAPDMTQPENYMRALEQLLPLGYEISFEFAYGHFECCIERVPASIADWSGAGATIGHSIVEALARLYDSEHVEELK